MIKKTVFIALLLFSIKIAKAQSPYTLPLPQGWGSEKLSLPIDFAPGIPIKGIEELRFTPGWGKSTTAEYWSYAFLWFMDGQPKFDKDSLRSYLTQYFNGLYLSNLKDKTGAASNFTKAEVKKVKTLVNDDQTYEATIETLDFLTHQPIKFNARLHIRNFAVTGHTVALFEISPQVYKNVVWDKLDGVVNGFAVNK